MQVLIGLMSVVRLCAGVEGTLASARATPLSEEPPSLERSAQANQSGTASGAKSAEDAVDELGEEQIQTSALTPPKVSADPDMASPPSRIDEQTGSKMSINSRGASLTCSGGSGTLRVRC